MQDFNFILLIFNFTIPCVDVCLYMYVVYVAHFLWVLQKLSLVGLIVMCCRYLSVSFQSFVLNFITGDHTCLQHQGNNLLAPYIGQMCLKEIIITEEL